jgi:bifunctional UDP-N-acetylglucosamine pyrophosphorylase/glucosamine-1-phosphate N-acetyltransferase
MPKRSCLAIVLAAGEGTRMKSATPKVLHKVGGLPLIGHVLNAVSDMGATRVAVVVGANAEAVGAFVGGRAPHATLHEQRERLGTAHAVLAARSALANAVDDVVVLYGDTPMVSAETLVKARAAIADGLDVAVVGFRTDNPTGYGRLVMVGPQLTAIVEEKDASKAERRIDFCNSGIMAFRGEHLLGLLTKIGNDNAKREYYLTDVVALAHAAGRKVGAVEASAHEAVGVNDRMQLSHAEGLFQKAMRETAMEEGATMVAPSTVWFSYDTRVGRDVTIEPNVFFGPGVTVGDNVVIRANSHIEGAQIEKGAIVGPFARLRPGAVIGPDAHIGNFVEVKNATVGDGAKANHLSYIGDAEIGAKANIGAGTITANYDGFDKYRTVVGKGASIGSNTVLVAPVSVGNGATVGAGSVITHDVPDDALAVARARQEDRPGWSAKFRERKQAAKAAKKPATKA